LQETSQKKQEKTDILHLKGDSESALSQTNHIWEQSPLERQPPDCLLFYSFVTPLSIAISLTTEQKLIHAKYDVTLSYFRDKIYP